MSVLSEWGMCCPTCGSDEFLRVEVHTMAQLTSDGTDIDGDHEWTDESYITCTDCDWSGEVREATAAGTAKLQEMEEAEDGT
jgi:predicted nucleic-acid-binding Zn-ribbon protein